MRSSNRTSTVWRDLRAPPRSAGPRTKIKTAIIRPGTTRNSGFFRTARSSRTVAISSSAICRKYVCKRFRRFYDRLTRGWLCTIASDIFYRIMVVVNRVRSSTSPSAFVQTQRPRFAVDIDEKARSSARVRPRKPHLVKT